MMLDHYDKLIQEALGRVYDVADKTPLSHAAGLSAKLNNHIYLKREDMQPVFSFKIRGAYNHIACLSDEELQCGVIASSAGNHAQGVALSAKRKGIQATIVMPRTTPGIKIKAVEALGGNVVLHGDIYDEAYAKAIELSEQEGLTYIHPYDTDYVIAGQATIAKEILDQCPTTPDVIFVPVGGGGLVSGIALHIKKHAPHVKVIAVEADDAATLNHSLKQGERSPLDHVGSFADGTAVRIIGENTFSISKDLIDDSITVSHDEICAAIKDIFENTRTIVEPAGALATAGIKHYVATHNLHDKTLVGINSGANVNFDRLRYISERAEMGENKEIIFSATIPERPGSFKRFCSLIGARSVTEFNYRFTDKDDALIFVGIELQGGKKGKAEKEALYDTLNGEGFDVLDLTNNEVAKLHIKHMIGGKPEGLQNERLFRVQFPERPGALMNFLQKMDPTWNISLFHYRNYGSSFGRVLVGIQVPPDDQERFQNFVNDVGYKFYEETDNSAYKLFLST